MACVLLLGSLNAKLQPVTLVCYCSTLSLPLVNQLFYYESSGFVVQIQLMWYRSTNSKTSLSLWVTSSEIIKDIGLLDGKFLRKVKWWSDPPAFSRLVETECRVEAITFQKSTGKYLNIAWGHTKISSAMCWSASSTIPDYVSDFFCSQHWVWVPDTAFACLIIQYVALPGKDVLNIVHAWTLNLITWDFWFQWEQKCIKLV